MADEKQSPIDIDVYFTDAWSEGIYTLDEVARLVEENPDNALQYHVARSNVSYARYLEDRSSTAHSNLIQRVTNAITSAHTAQELYDLVVRICQLELGAQASALFLEDEGRQHLRATSASGYAKNLLTSDAVYAMGQDITGKVWETGKTVKCDSHDAMVAHPWRAGKYDKHQWSDGARCENLVFVALQHTTAPFGVLKVENKRLGVSFVPFSDQDVATLELIASLIAYSVRYAMSSELGSARHSENPKSE